MPLKKKNNKWKTAVIIVCVLVLLALMIFTFSAHQNITEVVLYPN